MGLYYFEQKDMVRKTGTPPLVVQQNGNTIFFRAQNWFPLSLLPASSVYLSTEFSLLRSEFPHL
jgi:hypothetical protein